MPDKDAGTPRVYLVRHGTLQYLSSQCALLGINFNAAYIPTWSDIATGETEWTTTGRYTGRSDIPLTKNGELQVSSSASKVVGVGKLIDPSRISRLFISPRIRASRTYELLFDNAARANLEGLCEITEDIREWDYGLYDGQLTSEVRAGRKERGLDTERPWNIWIDGCEGGESAKEVSNRLDRIIAKIREIQGPDMWGGKGVDVVLIAHGHILRAFAKRWINFDLGMRLPLMLGPGAVGVLSYEHHNEIGRAHV